MRIPNINADFLKILHLPTQTIVDCGDTLKNTIRVKLRIELNHILRVGHLTTDMIESRSHL
ncbi:Uncharacterised protein [Vibrio cholerae]|nr:Uncharacterised protein [Vibrio cholerae]CSI89097.1 Uncharacterised protein [Vibrio cholerae]